MIDLRLTLLHKLAEQKLLLTSQVDCGIISTVDATNELEMLNTKEFKLKESLVKEKHVGKGNVPRAIAFSESKGLYYTRMADNSQIYAKTKRALIEKLFDYYGLTLRDTTIQAIFTEAITAKEKESAAKQNTILRLKQDYDYLITDEFAKRDILMINKSDLRAYFKETALRDITYNRLKSLRTILNLIFDYALENEIIFNNPFLKFNIKEYQKLCRTTFKAPEDEVLTAEELEKVKNEMRSRISSPRNKGYFANAFLGLFAIETGGRIGELCALKWSDINFEKRHYTIHAQQGLNRLTREYFYDSSTKDEKGVSAGGRKCPLFANAYELLVEIKQKQAERGIHTEFVFARQNGEWVLAETYEKWLHDLMDKLNIKLTGNHVFRKTLNSNTYIPAGISDIDRAAILGHSVETNNKYYTYYSDEQLDRIRRCVDEYNSSPCLVHDNTIINFDAQKNKTSRIRGSQGFN